MGNRFYFEKRFRPKSHTIYGKQTRREGNEENTHTHLHVVYTEHKKKKKE